MCIDKHLSYKCNCTIGYTGAQCQNGMLLLCRENKTVPSHLISKLEARYFASNHDGQDVFALSCYYTQQTNNNKQLIRKKRTWYLTYKNQKSKGKMTTKMPKGKRRTKQDKKGNREERHRIDLTQFKFQSLLGCIKWMLSKRNKSFSSLVYIFPFMNVFILEADSKDI